MDLNSTQHPTTVRVEKLLENDRNKKKQAVEKDDSSSSDGELKVSLSEVSVSQLTGPSQLLTGPTQLEPMIHVPAAATNGPTFHCTFQLIILLVRCLSPNLIRVQLHRRRQPNLLPLMMDRKRKDHRRRWKLCILI
jgi:hypothetical protein